MRVLLVNDYATPMGGAELSVGRLRDTLRARGHDVRLLASNATTLPEAVDADYTAFGTMHPRGRVLTETANPSAARQLRRALAGFRPDVVHVRMFLSQLSPLLLPLLRSVPSVYHAVFYKAICPVGTRMLPDGRVCEETAGRACLRHRCVTPQSWVAAMAQLALWRRWRSAFDVVVAPTRTMRRRLGDAGIGPVRLIPNGVAARPARPALSGPPTVAFAGRLVAEKGPDLLVRAFAEAGVPDARLVIAGQGPLRDHVAALARAHGVADQLELPGHLPRPDLEQRFDAAWVQAVPGRWEEPFGNVTLEGMVRGTAMVVTDVGGPGEVIDHGRTGLVVPPGDVGALAAALRGLLTDAALADHLGRAARATALEEYSDDRLADRCEALYAGLVSAYRAAPDAAAAP